ncbi:hypothetical protein BT69DRAFT_294178 [Atractiella rhizophila]|nr:hypothetical protein BT69DRAFT_294178 [Atractiella rhizophila]
MLTVAGTLLHQTACCLLHLPQSVGVLAPRAPHLVNILSGGGRRCQPRCIPEVGIKGSLAEPTRENQLILAEKKQNEIHYRCFLPHCHPCCSSTRSMVQLPCWRCLLRGILVLDVKRLNVNQAMNLM